MAVISLTIPSAWDNRVLDAFANVYGWNASLGVSKAQFAKQKLIDHIKDVVIMNEGQAAADTAKQATVTDVQGNLSVT
jgi:hypothetical protein